MVHSLGSCALLSVIRDVESEFYAFQHELQGSLNLAEVFLEIYDFGDAFQMRKFYWSFKALTEP